MEKKYLYVAGIEVQEMVLGLPMSEKANVKVSVQPGVKWTNIGVFGKVFLKISSSPSNTK